MIITLAPIGLLAVNVCIYRADTLLTMPISEQVCFRALKLADVCLIDRQSGTVSRAYVKPVSLLIGHR